MLKTVLITGVSSGIGKALAKKFLSEGFFVIGTSPRGTAEIKSENLRLFSLDLSSPESIEKCSSEIIQFGKKLDIFINNAAIWIDKESPVLDIGILRKTLEVDLIGTIDFAERILRIVNEGAHIINVTSRSGSLWLNRKMNATEYKIAKAGLNMYTRILSTRLEGKATVSSVHPGAVKTQMAAPDANMEPEEAALHIYNHAISSPETGQFWFKGEKFPW